MFSWVWEGQQEKELLSRETEMSLFLLTIFKPEVIKLFNHTCIWKLFDPLMAEDEQLLLSQQMCSKARAGGELCPINPPVCRIPLLLLLTPACQAFLAAWIPALESTEMFQAESGRAQECVLYKKKKKKPTTLEAV